MRGSTALESANALFRRAQAPANAERLSTNIWDGVTATRSTRRWLHRGRAFAVAPSSFALDIPHVAFSTGEGICQRKAESSVSFSGARARCEPNPPLWADSEMQQPILGLYTAPPRLELVVWACLGPPWPSLPAEPCDPPSVGHFSLASKGTERGPHRPACGMR